jgi:hypothetical protein
VKRGGQGKKKWRVDEEEEDGEEENVDGGKVGKEEDLRKEKENEEE